MEPQVSALHGCWVRDCDLSGQALRQWQLRLHPAILDSSLYSKTICPGSNIQFSLVPTPIPFLFVLGWRTWGPWMKTTARSSKQWTPKRERKCQPHFKARTRFHGFLSCFESVHLNVLGEPRHQNKKQKRNEYQDIKAGSLGGTVG